MREQYQSSEMASISLLRYCRILNQWLLICACSQWQYFKVFILLCMRHLHIIICPRQTNHHLIHWPVATILYHYTMLWISPLTLSFLLIAWWIIYLLNDSAIFCKFYICRHISMFDWLLTDGCVATCINEIHLIVYVKWLYSKSNT